MEKSVSTPEELEAEAIRFARSLAKGSGNAILVTLSGELGAGKTAFVKGVAKAFGIEETVNSPTFILEKVYLLLENKLFKRLVHVDAYRLEKGNDLKLLGFNELMRDPDNLILLEWPERVAGALPVPATRLSFVVQQDGSRILSYG